MTKLLLLCTTFVLSSLAFETEYFQGKHLYFAKGCANCHGTQAEGSSYYPKLAHIKQELLLQKLEDFKSKKANSQKAEIMFTFANSLQKEEMHQITKFLSTYKDESSEKYKIDDDILGSVE